jgi:hypothetical protein
MSSTTARVMPVFGISFGLLVRPPVIKMIKAISQDNLKVNAIKYIEKLLVCVCAQYFPKEEFIPLRKLIDY